MRWVKSCRTSSGGTAETSESHRPVSGCAPQAQPSAARRRAQAAWGGGRQESEDPHLQAAQGGCLAGSRARIEIEVPDGPLSLPALADLPGSPGLKLVNHKCLIAFYCFGSKKICCQKILTSFYFTQEPCSCWMWSLGSTLTPRSVQSCQYCAATPVGSPTRGPLAVYWLDTTAMALGYYHVGLCAMPIIVMAEFPGCTSPSGL